MLGFLVLRSAALADHQRGQHRSRKTRFHFVQLNDGHPFRRGLVLLLSGLAWGRRSAFGSEAAWVARRSTLITPTRIANQTRKHRSFREIAAATRSQGADLTCGAQ
jgi:hypothetical protein